MCHLHRSRLSQFAYERLVERDRYAVRALVYIKPILGKAYKLTNHLLLF